MAGAPSKIAQQLALCASKELQRESRHVTTGVGRKSNPARLKVILKSMCVVPIMATAARTAGCSTSAIKNWLQKSHKGAVGDGFDVEFRGETMRFHEAWAEAVAVGDGRVEQAAFEFALGYNELGVYRGRVQYQYDPQLLALGFTAAEAYLRDENGKPIPEMITKQDPEMIRWLLERRMRETYGKHTDVDVRVSGGVLVVGARAKTSEELTALAAKQKLETVDVEFREVEDEGA